MTVIERAENGYVKGRDKNGNTFYRDSNGHPVSQQAYAASKSREKYEPELDPDTGKITGNEPKHGGGGGGNRVPTRISLSFRVDETSDSPAYLEVRHYRVGMAPPGTDIESLQETDDGKTILEDMLSDVKRNAKSAGQIGFNNHGDWPSKGTGMLELDSENIAVEVTETREAPGTSDGEILIYNGRNEYTYELDSDRLP